MKRFFTHPSAKYVMGGSIGLPWLERISLLDLSVALANRWHSHDDTEIICCLKGALTYEFRDRQTVTVPAGGIVIVPAGTEHRNTEGIDEPSRRLSFFVRRRQTWRAGRLPADEFAALRAALAKRSLKPLKIPSLSIAPLECLAECAARGGPRGAFETLGTRARTVSAVLSFLEDGGPTPQTARTRMIDEAVKWLEAHYAEEVALPQLVAYMGYSCSRLCRLFKERTGLSPIDWLIRYRISRARALLAGGGLTVAEVAQRTGFRDPSFFSRVFKRRTGVPPLGYMRSRAAATARMPSPRKNETAVLP